MKEIDISKNPQLNETRDYFLQYAFKYDFPKDPKIGGIFNHGLSDGPAAKESFNEFRYYRENFSFSEVWKNMGDYIFYIPIYISSEDYDFLKSHVDMRRLSTFVYTFNNLQPFYGKMEAINELYKTMFRYNKTDVIPVEWCWTTPLMILDMYKEYMKRGKVPLLCYGAFDTLVKTLFREMLKNKVYDESIALNYIVTLFALLGENAVFDRENGHRMGETLLSTPYSTLSRVFYATMDTFNKNGHSGWLSLIKEVETNEILYYVTEKFDGDNKVIERKAKPISFENLMKEKTGFLNADAYYLLPKIDPFEGNSFEYCMLTLGIFKREEN